MIFDKSKSEKGFALIGVIVLVVLIAVAGGAGYFVMTKNKDKTSNTAISKADLKVAEAECKKQIDDKDFCKFVSSWKLDGEYKITVKTSGGSEAPSLFVTESDSKGNTSTVMTSDSGEETKFIALDGSTYTYDKDNSVWIKYSKSSDTTQITDNIDSELNFDDSSLPESERSTYVPLGKEACGNKTCFKYQIKDPASPNMEQFVWFNDKNYELYKFMTTEDGSTSEMTIEYVNVEIKEPSPVKEYTTPEGTPTEAELQEMLQAIGQ